MADTVSFGPDGFPLCACGRQIRAASEQHPELCSECVAELPKEEPAPAANTSADLGGGWPA